ncbi:hypothetical protein Efla_004837 [Eimeria flavescens]
MTCHTEAEASPATPGSLRVSRLVDRSPFPEVVSSSCLRGRVWYTVGISKFCCFDPHALRSSRRRWMSCSPQCRLAATRSRQAVGVCADPIQTAAAARGRPLRATCQPARRREQQTCLSTAKGTAAFCGGPDIAMLQRTSNRPRSTLGSASVVIRSARHRPLVRLRDRPVELTMWVLVQAVSANGLEYAGEHDDGACPLRFVHADAHNNKRPPIHEWLRFDGQPAAKEAGEAEHDLWRSTATDFGSPTPLATDCSAVGTLERSAVQPRPLGGGAHSQQNQQLEIVHIRETVMRLLVSTQPGESAALQMKCRSERLWNGFLTCECDDFKKQRLARAL